MIISLSGAIGSGKDTLAKHLIENHGFTKVSFSGVLKDIVGILFQWPRPLLEGDTRESREWREQVDEWWTDELDLGVEITPRWALQNIATEVFRQHFHQDIWILAVKRQLGLYPNAVITDARFLNELSFLSEMGGTMVGVYRNIDRKLEAFYRRYTALCETQLITPFARGMSSKYLQTSCKLFALEANKTTLQRHASEVEYLVYPDYDAVIDNTGALEKSIDQLEHVLSTNKR